MITRTLQNKLSEKLFKGKAILLFGPRQVGKITLTRQLLEATGHAFQHLDGDDPTIRRLLENPNTEQLRQLAGTASILFIDEAQRIPNIGITAKLITDQLKDKQLIVSGSSSFELNGFMQEPLTGRKWSYELFPVSWAEWENHIGYIKSTQDLDNRLIYGLYPDVLNHPEEQQEVLNELVDSYLYKDVLTYAGIRKPEVIQKLAQALAHQTGQEVVYSEISKLIGIDTKTVSHYIDILEKAYIVFRLPAFCKNLRNEIKTNRKIYFYDNGIRNAVIHAYKPISSRQDIGALWENFLISERVKQLRYAKDRRQIYFWRTKQQQEIDFVEEKDDEYFGYEFKWNPNQKIRFSKTFTSAYNASVKGITKENFREFVYLND